jgi:hypothetical protein
MMRESGNGRLSLLVHYRGAADDVNKGERPDRPSGSPLPFECRGGTSSAVEAGRVWKPGECVPFHPAGAGLTASRITLLRLGAVLASALRQQREKTPGFANGFIIERPPAV